MRWLKRLLLVTGFLLVAGVAILVAGSLLSLDWDRRHTARTTELPLLGPGQGDGLVRIQAGGMTFRARVGGLENSGPGLILLHGFPETSVMWKPLVDAAAAAGYRVVAFDQRGYSPGARPSGVDPYVLPELVGDVLAVADAAGFERFHLVGHDWGCVVGWGVAMQHPERLHSWSGLSIPHPGALFAELQNDLPAYIDVFTAPWLPELVFTWNRLALLRAGLGDRLTDEARNEVLDVFLEPGALTAALNWYRAITVSLEAGQDPAIPVRVPTLFVWGSSEGWVTEDALERQRELVVGPYTELELDSSHWLMEDAPGPVVAAILEHLQGAE